MGSRAIPAFLKSGFGLNWRAGLLLALPFFITTWASGHWPISGSASLSAGDVALQFAFFYLAVFSLYVVLCSIVNRNTAFWAALFMGLNPWFLVSESMTGSIAYALGAAVLITWSAKYKQSTILMVLAGGLFALSVCDHVFALTYLPILFLTFLYLNHDKDKQTVWLDSALFIAGFMLGGLFLFDVQGMAQAIGASQASFAEAVSLEQLPTYLHILTALWLLSAILLFKAKSKEGYSGVAAVWSDPATRPYGFCLSLCFVYGLIILTIEGGYGFNVLSFTSLASFCIPLVCIGLAGVLERGGFKDEQNHRHAAALFLVSLMLFSCQPVQSLLIEGLGSFYLWTVLMFWTVSLTLLLQLPAMQKFSARRAAVISLVLLAGFFLAGHDNPVWKKSGPADSTPQLTQVIEQPYK
jgi:hypothetical protein